MYAVIKAGGKQHRVTKGEQLKLEKLDIEPGQDVTFEEVLLVNTGDDLRVGTPVVQGASVSAKVLAQDKHRKIEVFTYKRRKNQHRHLGHRQPFTLVEITGISVP